MGCFKHMAASICNVAFGYRENPHAINKQIRFDPEAVCRSEWMYALEYIITYC